MQLNQIIRSFLYHGDKIDVCLGLVPPIEGLVGSREMPYIEWARWAREDRSASHLVRRIERGWGGRFSQWLFDSATTQEVMT